jgi:dTDP-glucose 4,6-dehydratase
MRILITGGCGFLGHHVVEHLLKNTTADLVVLDKLTYASKGFDRLRAISAWDHTRVRVLGCDLALPIPDGIDREMGVIDYVIHAAAESHVDNSIHDPMPFIQSNVIGTHNLLWWAKTRIWRSVNPKPAGWRDLRRIFCVSTDEVYGPATWDEPGHTVEHAFRPANPYAAAKAGGECIAMAYANTYRLPVTIVNTMNLIGERQHPEKYVPMVIRKVLLGETVSIHADPTCTRSGTRFYIHCRNYADALLWLIQHDEVIPLGALKLHVAGERELSNLDLAQKIAAVVGKPLRYELVNFHQSRPGHDLRYALDGSRIRTLGWQQPIDIDHSLERVVRWYLDDKNSHWLSGWRQ